MPNGWMTRRDMAEIYAEVAKEYEARGDDEAARRFKTKAREVSWRDGWAGARRRAAARG